MITRIPIANIYYLLCYAWNRLEEDDLTDVGELQGTDPANLFARLLSAATRRAMRRGLNRDYLGRREDLTCVRGRMLATESFRRLLPEHGRAACEFDELDHNNLPNGILVATLANLRDADSISTANREDLGWLLEELRMIDPVDLQPGIFRRVRLHRSNARYGWILYLCEMAYGCMMPAAGGGPHRFRSFVQDHARLAEVFQDFVRNFYVAHAAEIGCSYVGSPRIAWNAVSRDDDSCGLLPTMLTDVALRVRGRGIIIECKFYHEALAGRFRDRLNSAHLYQLFAYIMNQRQLSGWRKCEGLLLYPSVTTDFTAEYDMDGNRIRAATVDLGQSWDRIHSRLLSLVTN